MVSATELLKLTAYSIGFITMAAGSVFALAVVLEFLCDVIYKKGGHSKEFLEYLLWKRKQKRKEGRL